MFTLKFCICLVVGALLAFFLGALFGAWFGFWGLLISVPMGVGLGYAAAVIARVWEEGDEL